MSVPPKIYGSVPTCVIHYNPRVPVTDQIMAQARRADRSAVEAILTESFPAVHRIAHALTGEERAGTAVCRHVLRRAVRVMPRWRRGITPENWFYHHTLLVTREAAAQALPLERDLLVTASPGGRPAYVAFVRALRGLPRQQMEAFVLNHGEKLNSRLLGVAMDCSASAAATHLVAATDALRTIAGELYDDMVPALERAYATLTPPETFVRTTVARQVSAGFWAMRLRRMIRWIIALALLAAIGYAVWRWHALLLQWFEILRSRATTQSAS
jgi:DNA-directed RNA polymerase specialized sigma24 family protein